MTNELRPGRANPVITGIVAAIGIVVVVGVCAVVMFGITTFLFASSGGQYRMTSVVGYGALAVVGSTLLAAAVVWVLRSRAAALKWAAIATLVGWAAAVVVEWRISFVLGAS